MTDLWRRSAIDLAHLIATRQASATEVVTAHLERIAAVNGRLNAVVRVLDETALAAASAADARLAAGEAVGPLHGVPVTVKENIDMAGLPTTSGVRALAGAIAAVDAPVVERLRAAGAIPIGRTNLPDMGLRVHTDSELHGLTRNPWSHDRTAGGSSGGEGAAIASGMSPLGLGNDIGGSLRNPANVCGIASIRPTLGRVPNASADPAAKRPFVSQAMAVDGPMARRVADVRLGLRIIMGAHPRDPWARDVPFEGAPIDGRIRVAVVASPPGGFTEPAVSAAVRRAADALADAGYDLVEAHPPGYEAAVDLWRRLLLGDLALGLPMMTPLMGADGRGFLDTINAATPPFEDPLAMSRALVERDAIARDWSMFLADHPLILSPTWTTLPFLNGYDIESAAASMAVIDLIRPVVPANLLGLPSACVPAGLDPASGLPVGVLLTGRWMRDDLCLDAARAVEARLGLATPIDPAW